MNRTLLAMATAIGWAGSAFAQAEPDSNPLRFTVKPSGFEAPANENQERQERLLRRLEQSNHMIRSICTHCGDGWKHQIYAPFHPLASLGRKGSGEEAPE